MKKDKSLSAPLTKKATTADAKFMKKALELARLAQRHDHGQPFGSVVVKEGKIVGEGWNQSIVKTDPSAHAEVEAIRDACKELKTLDLTGSTVYASAQPCPMCLSLMYLTGISKVYYCIPHSQIEELYEDLSIKYIYDELSKPRSKRKIHEIQILPEVVNKCLHCYSVR